MSLTFVPEMLSSVSSVMLRSGVKSAIGRPESFNTFSFESKLSGSAFCRNEFLFKSSSVSAVIDLISAREILSPGCLLIFCLNTC